MRTIASAPMHRVLVLLSVLSAMGSAELGYWERVWTEGMKAASELGEQAAGQLSSWERMTEMAAEVRQAAGELGEQVKAGAADLSPTWQQMKASAADAADLARKKAGEAAEVAKRAAGEAAEVARKAAAEAAEAAKEYGGAAAAKAAETAERAKAKADTLYQEAEQARQEYRAAASAKTRERASQLGVLPLLTDAGVDGPDVLANAVAWCDKHGASSLEEIVRYGMDKDFVAALALKAIPQKRVEGLLSQWLSKEEL